MKKHGIGSRLLALLLVLAMVLPMMPMQAEAAKYDYANVDTGLVDNKIDTEDTISLPIQILDYEADGILFEYAESNLTKKPADFGATYACDYTDDGVSAYSSTVVYAYTADYTSRLQNTGEDNQYMQVTYAKGDGADYISYFNQSSYDAKTGTTYKLSQIRYLVFVYRARSISSTSMSFGLDTTSGYSDHSSSHTSASFSVSMGTDWTYQIVDLYSTGASASTTVYGILMNAPMISSGNYLDVAYAAYFADKDQAEAFAEYALTKGSNSGDNRAFGLLRSSRNEVGTDAFASIVDWDTSDTIVQLNTYSYNNVGDGKGDHTREYNEDTESYEYTYVGDGNGAWTKKLDLSAYKGLGYTLLGTFFEEGIANLGLLQDTLVNGKPVYKPEVVEYLALLLQSTLPLPERTSDGWKNYRYISSELADELRSRITGGLGTYPTGDAAKGLIGTWDQCQGNIKTYYDAAYFLLNSIFIDNSYNTPQDEKNNGNEYYDYLVLSAATDYKTGDKVYVFDGGFSTSSDPETADMAIDYNTATHTIQNTSAAGKAHFYYQWWSSTNSGDTTTLNPFLPITDKNDSEGQTVTPYWQDDGVVNIHKTEMDTLVNRDYNFAMYSSGEFVYHADDELFFAFEGDDDVYLFINDVLVMDIGSAHSIDSVRIELNDYVNAAKQGTLASAAQNERLALVEGDTYNFDFFYMERHSYGSNMRINTNIRISDPSMTTDKTAYVDGVQVEYGGIVNAGSIVEYGFKITNEGGENLYNIGFTDNDIGVKLDPVNGLTITGPRVYSLDGTHLEPGNTAHRDKLVKELTAVLGGENREQGFVYDPITVTFADNDALIAFLKKIQSDAAIESGGGLWKGSYVSFRGIGYMLSDEQIQSGWFDNTVFTTATNKTGSKTLKSQDTMRVCVPSDPMYYQWAGHDLQIPLTKLVADITAAANQEGNALSGKTSDLTAARVTNMVEITKGGYGVDYPQVTVNSDFSLTVNYTTVGSYVFYLKIYYKISDSNWPNVIVPIVVNVTDVEDSVFVLDYGLKADLTENGGKELFKNDTLSVPGRDTATTILAMGTNGVYSPNEITIDQAANGTLEALDGTFSFNKDTQKLLFTPTDFMEDTYTTQIAVNVYEQGITPTKITGTLDINNEVEMYKTITVLPATVVYYEDDFPAIDYITQTKNTFTRLGESTDESQGVDQEENYGHDDTYADGSNTSMSAGVLTTITIGQEGPVAKFTFKGTGFELISRTNAYDAATLDVAVFKGTAKTVVYENYQYVATDESGKELTRERMIPVINEFDNGGDGGSEEIYQVPVIRVDDLPLDTYTVVIGGVPAYDWEQSVYPDGMVVIPTELYVDGLRIFQPLGDSNDNYDTDENGAVFQELRELIADGIVAVATYNGETVNVSTGTTTWTENRNGQYYDDVYENTDEIPVYEGNKVESVNAYLLMGPNHEVYMDGTMTDAALAFYVTESGAENAEHQLQIAVHAVDQGLFHSGTSTGMNAPIYYGVKNGEEYAWKPLVTVFSATEQYYTIPYTECPLVDGKYQVALKVDIEGSDFTTAMASYTTLKLTNLTLQSIGGEPATLRYNDGVLEEWNDNTWTPVYGQTPEDGTQTAGYPAFEALSRQMSVSVLAKGDDSKPTEPSEPKPIEPAPSFDDVPENAFYFEAVQWAVENGVTNGTGEATFSPERKVTRAEAVTFLWRAAGEPEPTAENPFEDVSENSFYYKAVLWAVENNITNGVDATHFAPLSVCNRAQVVTFLYRSAGEPIALTAEHPFTDVSETGFYYDAMLWAVENGITTGVSASAFGPNAVCNRAQIVTFLHRAA